MSYVARTHILRGPECQLVVKHGMGANSWALLALLQRQRMVPRAIIMSDPGSEWPETWAFYERAAPWLATCGFPAVTIVSRASEAPYRRREITKTETLFEECERLEYPPSAAFGLKRCSMVYKAEPSFWWLQRQKWAQFEHGMRRRINVAIGYDIDEPHRWRHKDEFTSNATEREWCYPTYPLVEAGMGRDECEALCLEVFGAVPPKSACMGCPNNTLSDWYRLAERHPDEFLRLVSLSRRAEKNMTSSATGFLRNAMPDGKRRLHTWYDGGYPNAAAPPVPGAIATFAGIDDGRDELPCECAL